MGAQGIRPQTPEEHLIFWAIAGTWGIWLLCGLYLLGAGLGYGLLLLAAARGAGLIEGRLHPPPPTVLLWLASMLVMALALVLAHIDYELGLGQTVKSLIGWLKGWALLAVLPLAGAMLSVRPPILYRATSLLALQTLVLAPVFLLAEVAGLPATLYVSPLHGLVGVGPEFFDVSLYAFDGGTGKARWRFFSPWSTAAAFVAGLSLIFALQERRWMWQAVGIVSAVVICQMSGSRLSMVVIPLLLLMVLILSNLLRPATWIALACLGTGLILLSGEVIEAYEGAMESFHNARAASSRVRAALANIAVHRWQAEAPLFGHGVLERGGHVVEGMLIGSHHTWWGLLFVRGGVGFAALALPLAVSIAALVFKAQVDRVARAALGVLLSLLMFSLADNVEIVAYLIWPGLLLVGIALRRPWRHPITAARLAPVQAAPGATS